MMKMVTFINLWLLSESLTLIILDELTLLSKRWRIRYESVKEI